MPRLILTAAALLTFAGTLHAAGKSSGPSHNSVYPYSPGGGYAGRSSGSGSSYFDSHGAYSLRTADGNIGAYTGRAVTPGTTNPRSDYARPSTYSGNSMGGYYDRRPYSGQAAASAGGVIRQYDARGRYVGSRHR